MFYLILQVVQLGMSEKVGQVSFNLPGEENSFVKPYSEETAQLIDREVRDIVQKAYQRTKDLLLKHKDDVEKVSEVCTVVYTVICPWLNMNSCH